MMAILAAASFLATPLSAMNADPNLGDATRRNLAAMIVPPTPPGNTGAGGDGIRNVAAVRRYHADKVKAPVASNMTTSGGGQ